MAQKRRQAPQEATQARVKGKKTPAKKKRPSYGIRERMEAEFAYVRGGESPAEIASALGCHKSTVKKWVRENGWQEARKAFLTSDAGAADILERQMHSMLLSIERGDIELSGARADLVLKLTKTIKELRGDKYTMVQTFGIMRQFVAHVREADPALLTVLEEQVEAFLDARRKTILGKS